VAVQRAQDDNPAGRDLAPAAIYHWPEITDEGDLIGYGPHITRIYGEILSRQLAELLRGTKPADIPAEQPSALACEVGS
jgi:hypothetical protein